MSRGGPLTGALLVTLARPATWALALAAFLVRGGLLVLVVPIVVLPTPVGLGDVVGPPLISFVFGGVSPAFVAVVATAVVLFLVWLIGGGLLAATAEAELIRIVATDEDVTTGTVAAGRRRGRPASPLASSGRASSRCCRSAPRSRSGRPPSSRPRTAS